MATAAFQKLLTNLSKNKKLQNLLENFQTLSEDIKKKEVELKGRFDAQKEEKIEMAWEKYQELVKVLSVSEGKLEKEVNQTITKFKKSADDLEKNIAAYKKKAMAKKAELEKSLFKKQLAKKTTKKAAAKKTTKKVAKKATAAKKTTKKAVKKTSKKA